VPSIVALWATFWATPCKARCALRVTSLCAGAAGPVRAARRSESAESPPGTVSGYSTHDFYCIAIIDGWEFVLSFLDWAKIVAMALTTSIALNGSLLAVWWFFLN
jgi:hypothetical protein